MAKTPKQPKTFSIHDVNPIKGMNEKQKDFLKAYFGQRIPIIVQSGSAGTGKSFLALYAAINDVLKEDTPTNKVVIVRSAVSARDIGFLPGTEEEKNEVYQSIYADIFDDIMKYQWRNYENLTNAGLVEFHNTSFLRGKTFDNAVVVFDEFQSCTYHEMSSVITRLGVDSRIILCGDLKQSDLHKKKDESGYSKLMNVLDMMPSDMIEHICYTPGDIVRSGLVKEFLMADEKVA